MHSLLPQNPETEPMLKRLMRKYSHSIPLLPSVH